MTINFDIKSRWTGSVIYTAEIKADEGTSYGVKLGLAVKMAVKARADLASANLARADLACANLADANLTGADLTGANLARADLACADLACADLADANLTDANLTGADLTGADLADANLTGADLTGADLASANLARANLASANLAGADLADADLTGADLAGADLADANLTGADLNGVSGLNDWIKCIQVEDWPINYTSEVMQIGCQRHTFDAWRNFSDAKIRAMDGRRALIFWRKWKSVIFQIIEMAPAQQTKAAEPGKTEASL